MSITYCLRSISDLAYVSVGCVKEETFTGKRCIFVEAVVLLSCVASIVLYLTDAMKRNQEEWGHGETDRKGGRKHHRRRAFLLKRSNCCSWQITFHFERRRRKSSMTEEEEKGKEKGKPQMKKVKKSTWDSLSLSLDMRVWQWEVLFLFLFFFSNTVILAFPREETSEQRPLVRRTPFVTDMLLAMICFSCVYLFSWLWQHWLPLYLRFRFSLSPFRVLPSFSVFFLRRWSRMGWPVIFINVLDRETPFMRMNHGALSPCSVIRLERPSRKEGLNRAWWSQQNSFIN